MNEFGLKLAFAKGYHAALIGAQYNPPYDDIECKIAFNSGYRTGKDQVMASLYNDEIHEVN